MKKILINFEMDSLESSVKFSTVGEYKNQQIEFQDNELNIHKVLFKEEIIEYYKTGSMDMKFVFNQNKPTKGIYNIDNNLFEFDILTSILDNTNNKLVVKYDLIQNNEIVNRSTLIIKYSITQEE